MQVGYWLVKVRVRWEAEGFAWKWSDSYHQHALHQVDMYVWEDDVTWPELALVIQGGSLGGLGWWSDICQLKNGCLLWAVTVFWSGFLRFLLLRFDCECNRPSFLATVFNGASVFNGDLDQWDVTAVTDMSYSKSIRILANDLTWRDCRVQSGGLGWWWWCDFKMVESWCWSMREIERTSMAHYDNVCGLWLTVILLWDVLMIFHAFGPLWDFRMIFHAFWTFSQTRLF